MKPQRQASTLAQTSACFSETGAEEGSPTHRAGKARGGRGAAPLAGLRLLVVEDDVFIGLDLAVRLEALGAAISGPHATIAAARAATNGERIDGAVLDVNLGRETSLDLARELTRAGAPVIFATAYPDRQNLFGGPLAVAPRLAKPVSSASLLHAAVKAFCADQTSGRAHP